MINELMMRFSQIRGSYARKKFGNLSDEDKALNEYDRFCLELIKEIDQLNEKVILLRASEPMLELEKYYGDRDKYKEVIEEVREYNNQIIKDTKDFYRPTEDVIYSGDTLIDLAETNIQILDKAKEI